MKFPQTQSNPLTNMVAELNAIIGKPHFKMMYYSYGRKYELAMTELGNSSKRFSFLASSEPMTFTDMFNYLNGILNGYRLAKQLHNL